MVHMLLKLNVAVNAKNKKVLSLLCVLIDSLLSQYSSIRANVQPAGVVILHPKQTNILSQTYNLRF